ncbi:MAG: NAD(P)/FAD-dependent oxidoreductase [bacterium]
MYQTDVLIIGGGAIGICTAYYLSRSGLRVTVVEKGKIGSGCSDKNAGLIVPSHIIPLAAPGMVAKGLKWMFNPESPFYLKPRLDRDLLAWLWSFSRACKPARMRRSVPVLNELLQASDGLFDDLATTLQNTFGLERKGLIMLYKTGQALQAEAKDAELAVEMGHDVRLLTPGELAELEPNIRMSAAGGIYYSHDAHLDPARFVAAVRRSLNPELVQVHPETAVQNLDVANGRIISVSTSRGIFEAREVVLAAGAWSSALVKGLGLNMLLQAGKGYSVTVKGSKQKPQAPVILAEARVAVTPMGEALRFAGTLELSGLDRSISRRRVNALLKAVPRYLPEVNPAERECTEVWSGLRPCSPDGLPYIGRVPQVHNLTVATGHAMLGMTLAPITGKLVSEIIQGQSPSIELECFAPDRCVRSNRFY